MRRLVDANDVTALTRYAPLGGAAAYDRTTRRLRSDDGVCPRWATMVRVMWPWSANPVDAAIRDRSPSPPLMHASSGCPEV
jgi:hypothetical protein